MMPFSSDDITRDGGALKVLFYWNLTQFTTTATKFLKDIVYFHHLHDFRSIFVQDFFKFKPV